MRLIVLVLAVVGITLFPQPADAPRWEYVPPAADVRQEETKSVDRFLPSRALPADFDPADVDLIARVIHAEARGEPFEGKVAVGAVIVNRVRDPRYPATVREVITEPGQFVIADRTSPECVIAAQAVFGEADPTGGALYFWSRPDGFTKTLRVTARVGGHTFGTDEDV